MAFRRGSHGPLSTSRKSARSSGGYRASVIVLLLVSVVAPLTILVGQSSNLFTSGQNGTNDSLGADDVKRRSALEAIESLIPKEVCSLTLTYISDSFGGLACCFIDAVVCRVF
jgi:hypothetical protein